MADPKIGLTPIVAGYLNNFLGTRSVTVHLFKISLLSLP